MELLSPNSPDLASTLFQLVRVRSTLWCRSELGAPWGFSVPRREKAAFHFVVSGECVLAVDGSDQLALGSGDLVIVPHGEAHVARSGATATPRPLDDILESYPAIDGRLAYGGDGPRTEMLCGGFEVDDPTGQLRAALPRVMHVRGELDPAIATTIDAIRATLAAGKPGTDAVVARLTDVVLTLAIQASVAGSPSAKAFLDPTIASVIRSVEERPEQAWSVTALAQRAHLSRSVFVERFRHATNESPMRFVTGLRLARAAVLLHDRESTLDDVATRSGFDSAASLSRAFKRRYGKSPGAYRRERLDGVGSSEAAAHSA